MRLLREIVVNGVQDFNALVDVGGSPIRGVSAAIYNNLVDPVDILSGFDLAVTAVEFHGAPVATGGEQYHFGGPVHGPNVFLNWSGTPDFKRGVFRFWDEPIESFGRVPLASFDELAVAAGGDSADFAVNYPGVWTRRQVVAWWGTQAFRIDRLHEYGPVIPAAKFQGGANVANQLALFEVGISVPDRQTYSFHNTGAGAGDVHAMVMAYLGAT